jgi:hypothetical protein
VADASASRAPLGGRATAGATVPECRTCAPDAEHPAAKADRLAFGGAAHWIRFPAAG